MKEIKKVSLIGLGGIGASFGAKIHKFDSSMLRIAADSKRIEKYKNNGIYINNERVDFNYFTPDTNIEKADLLIIATKYQGLKDAIEESKNHVKDDTIIMSLLNGIESEDIIHKYYPNNKVLYSFVVGSDIVREKVRITYENLGNITFGDKNNEFLSKQAALVKDLFDKSGVPYNIPINMEKAMWCKFMFNVGINQSSAVLEAPYGVFKEIPESREVMKALMNEVVQISVKAGVNLSSEDMDLFLNKTLPSLSARGKTSMLQDIEAGRKTEVEMFAKTVVNMGIKYNIPTPVNQVFYNMIRTKEQIKI
ncbi:MAG: ketopantoate reductase family protein [Clostridiaceae bacterium]